MLINIIYIHNLNTIINHKYLSNLVNNSINMPARKRLTTKNNDLHVNAG